MHRHPRIVLLVFGEGFVNRRRKKPEPAAVEESQLKFGSSEGMACCRRRKSGFSSGRAAPLLKKRLLDRHFQYSKCPSAKDNVHPLSCRLPGLLPQSLLG